MKRRVLADDEIGLLCRGLGLIIEGLEKAHYQLPVDDSDEVEARQQALEKQYFAAQNLQADLRVRGVDLP